jgi:glycosyltransferase involved in cell wall biosynthesis
MEISVIIPNLNSTIVDKTVQSILDQCDDKFCEIIVVGIDQHNLLKPFDGQIENITTSTPIPPGSARNLGVEKSRGDLLIFIDSDAVAHENFINGHINAHKVFNNAIVGGAVNFPSKPFLQLCDNISTFHEYMPHMPAGKKRMVPTVNLSIMRDKFVALSGFNDDPAGEDTEFAQKAVYHEIDIQFNPLIEVIHIPERKSIRGLFVHAYKLGNYTKLFDHFSGKYLNQKPGPMFKYWIVLFAPIIACLIIMKIFFLEHLPLKYWHTLPLVYLLKCAWCLGASSRYSPST